MKHLKRYNESFQVYGDKTIDGTNDESISEIVDIIKDRLIDLSDDGYSIDVYVRNVIQTGSGPYSVFPTGKKEISVRIEKPPYGLVSKGTYFYVRDILDSIESLISNMSSNFNVSIDACYSTRYVKIPRKFGDTYIDAIRTMGDSYVNGIDLTFHQRKSPKAEI